MNETRSLLHRSKAASTKLTVKVRSWGSRRRLRRRRRRRATWSESGDGHHFCIGTVKKQKEDEVLGITFQGEGTEESPVTIASISGKFTWTDLVPGMHVYSINGFTISEGMTSEDVQNILESQELGEISIVANGIVGKGKKRKKTDPNGISLTKDDRFGAIVIESIDPNGPLAQSGLEIGQRISYINDAKCPASLMDATELISEHKKINIVAIDVLGDSDFESISTSFSGDGDSCSVSLSDDFLSRSRRTNQTDHASESATQESDIIPEYDIEGKSLHTAETMQESESKEHHSIDLQVSGSSTSARTKPAVNKPTTIHTERSLQTSRGASNQTIREDESATENSTLENDSMGIMLNQEAITVSRISSPSKQDHDPILEEVLDTKSIPSKMHIIQDNEDVEEVWDADEMSAEVEEIWDADEMVVTEEDISSNGSVGRELWVDGNPADTPPIKNPPNEGGENVVETEVWVDNASIEGNQETTKKTIVRVTVKQSVASQNTLQDDDSIDDVASASNDTLDKASSSPQNSFSHLHLLQDDEVPEPTNFSDSKRALFGTGKENNRLLEEAEARLKAQTDRLKMAKRTRAEAEREVDRMTKENIKVEHAARQTRLLASQEGLFYSDKHDESVPRNMSRQEGKLRLDIEQDEKDSVITTEQSKAEAAAAEEARLKAEEEASLAKQREALRRARERARLEAEAAAAANKTKQEEDNLGSREFQDGTEVKPIVVSSTDGDETVLEDCEADAGKSSSTSVSITAVTAQSSNEKESKEKIPMSSNLSIQNHAIEDTSCPTGEAEASTDENTIPQITSDEEEALLEAEAEASLQRQREARLQAQVRARIRAEDAARAKAEEEARLQTAEKSRLKAEADARLMAEEEAKVRVEIDASSANSEKNKTRLKDAEAKRWKAEECARLKAEEEARIRDEMKALVSATLGARLKAEMEATMLAEEEEKMREVEVARRKARLDALLKSGKQVTRQGGTLHLGSYSTSTVGITDVFDLPGEDWVKASGDQKSPISDINKVEARLGADAEASLQRQREARLRAQERARLRKEDAARAKAEEEARLKAAEDARLAAEADARLKGEEETRIRAEVMAKLKEDLEAHVKAAEEARLKAAEESRLKADEGARLKGEEEARIREEERVRLMWILEAHMKAEEEARAAVEAEQILFAEVEARHEVRKDIPDNPEKDFDCDRSTSSRERSESDTAYEDNFSVECYDGESFSDSSFVNVVGRFDMDLEETDVDDDPESDESNQFPDSEALMQKILKNTGGNVTDTNAINTMAIGRLNSDGDLCVKAQEEASENSEDFNFLSYVTSMISFGSSNGNSGLSVGDESSYLRDDPACSRSSGFVGLDLESLDDDLLDGDDEALANFLEEACLKAEEDARLKVEEEARLLAKENALIRAEKQARLEAEEEARWKAEDDIRLHLDAEGECEDKEDALLRAEEAGRLRAEEEARLKVAEDVCMREEEEARFRAEEEARLKAEEEERLKLEEEARIKAEEEARIKSLEEARLKAELEARIKAAEEALFKAQADAKDKSAEKTEETVQGAATVASQMDSSKLLAKDKDEIEENSSTRPGRVELKVSVNDTQKKQKKKLRLSPVHAEQSLMFSRRDSKSDYGTVGLASVDKTREVDPSLELANAEKSTAKKRRSILWIALLLLFLLFLWLSKGKTAQGIASLLSNDRELQFKNLPIVGKLCTPSEDRDLPNRDLPVVGKLLTTPWRKTKYSQMSNNEDAKATVMDTDNITSEKKSIFGLKTATLNDSFKGTKSQKMGTSYSTSSARKIDKVKPEGHGKDEENVTRKRSSTKEQDTNHTGEWMPLGKMAAPKLSSPTYAPIKQMIGWNRANKQQAEETSIEPPFKMKRINEMYNLGDRQSMAVILETLDKASDKITESVRSIGSGKKLKSERSFAQSSNDERDEWNLAPIPTFTNLMGDHRNTWEVAEVPPIKNVMGDEKSAAAVRKMFAKTKENVLRRVRSRFQRKESSTDR